MSTTREEYLKRAEECERLAAECQLLRLAGMPDDNSPTQPAPERDKD